MRGYVGIATPWGIYLSRQLEGDRMSDVLRHELIHVDQWRRLGVIGFLRRYLGEYVAGRRAGHTHADAYARISLESEARRATR